MLALLRQRLRDDEDRVAEKRQGHGQREPLEDPLLGRRDVVVDRLLDKVAGGVGCGQRLASGAGRGRFGDVGVGVGCGDAADGEGGQEEDQHEQRVGVLQDGEGIVQRSSVLPARRLAVQLAVGQLGHGASAVRGARSLRLTAVAAGRWRDEGGRGGRWKSGATAATRRLHTPCFAEGGSVRSSDAAGLGGRVPWWRTSGCDLGAPLAVSTARCHGLDIRRV